MNKIGEIFILVSLVFTVSCSAKVGAINLTNDGRYAVILNNPLFSSDNKPIYLGTSETETQHLSIPFFNGYPDDIPSGQYELVWQLAEYSDCSEADFGRNRYSDCTYTAVPGKKYRLIIDFDQMRESYNFKTAGRLVVVKTGTFTWWMEPQRIRISFRFLDNKVNMKSKLYPTPYRFIKPSKWN